MAEAPDPFAAVRARFRERMVADHALLANAPVAQLQDGDTIRAVHRLAGLAGTLGYPAVSTAAKTLEERVVKDPFEAQDVEVARRQLLDELSIVLGDQRAPPAG